MRHRVGLVQKPIDRRQTPGLPLAAKGDQGLVETGPIGGKKPDIATLAGAPFFVNKAACGKGEVQFFLQLAQYRFLGCLGAFTCAARQVPMPRPGNGRDIVAQDSDDPVADQDRQFRAKKGLCHCLLAFCIFAACLPFAVIVCQCLTKAPAVPTAGGPG